MPLQLGLHRCGRDAEMPGRQAQFGRRVRYAHACLVKVGIERATRVALRVFS
jgi:hypothetical protein